MDPNTFRLMQGSAGAGSKLYIEDVFQTYLYTGTGSTQTITNGIDLSGKGGLVWTKNRNAGGNHTLIDTVRGTNKYLMSDSTNAEEASFSNILTAFNNNGYTLGSDQSVGNVNYSSAYTYASWTFRKQAKFFDVVTYTGNGTSQNISHSLGSTPGAVIIKATSAAYAWPVWHRSLATNDHLRLNTTDASFTAASYVSGVSSTTFSVGGGSQVNDSGVSYVAYLFAHDAGGFGDSGSDSVISCGSFAGGGTVTLGWEPQYILWKAYDAVGAWRINDNMRGLPTGAAQSFLSANTSDAESTNTFFDINPTGFKHLGSGNNYIYIAIRRGPMRTPTDATKVFKANTYTGNGSAISITGAGFPPDFSFTTRRDSASWVTTDKLRGAPRSLYAQSTDAEVDNGIYEVTSYNQDGISYGQNSIVNGSSASLVNHLFRRAPGFFDVVAYTGTGSARTLSHNLGVAPELMIVKKRSATDAWVVYANNDNTDYLVLNTTAATVDDNTIWNDTSPTSSVFTVGTNDDVNGNTATFIAYLFASASGVSKIGSYTGTGTTLSIDCGFTAGARFVLIKRTDSTGGWFVWDTARGIVSGNDPYLLLNSTAAEVTNTDFIDPLNSGFQISSTAPAAINANGGSFIFLAVA